MSDELDVWQEADPTGTPVVAVVAETVINAADILADATIDHQRLKIYSGEHVAAILTTAFLGTPPVNVDTDGGVDLLYERAHFEPGPFALSVTRSVAIEVKTLPGPMREMHSRIEWLKRQGRSAVGTSLSGTFESVTDIVPDVVALANETATKVANKLRDEQERHIFVIIHPFDRPTVEIYRNIILSPVLPNVDRLLDGSVARLWVLWFPSHLCLWSREDRCWIELLFSAGDPEDAPSDEVAGRLALLQEAECRFLQRVKPPGWSSPYIYGFSADATED